MLDGGILHLTGHPSSRTPPWGGSGRAGFENYL
jgi:hypothetical protein